MYGDFICHVFQKEFLRIGLDYVWRFLALVKGKKPKVVVFSNPFSFRVFLQRWINLHTHRPWLHNPPPPSHTLCVYSFTHTHQRANGLRPPGLDFFSTNALLAITKGVIKRGGGYLVNDPIRNDQNTTFVNNIVKDRESIWPKSQIFSSISNLLALWTGKITQIERFLPVRKFDFTL